MGHTQVCPVRTNGTLHLMQFEAVSMQLRQLLVQAAHYRPDRKVPTAQSHTEYWKFSTKVVEQAVQKSAVLRQWVHL